jgi:hypothetical protein
MLLQIGKTLVMNSLVSQLLNIFGTTIRTGLPKKLASDK